MRNYSESKKRRLRKELEAHTHGMMRDDLCVDGGWKGSKEKSTFFSLTARSSPGWLVRKVTSAESQTHGFAGQQDRWRAVRSIKSASVPDGHESTTPHPCKGDIALDRGGGHVGAFFPKALHPTG